jgi:hypothetical protein
MDLELKQDSPRDECAPGDARSRLLARIPLTERDRERYGWPLHIIEGCADDPPTEQPAAFLEAPDRVLHGTECPTEDRP